MRAWSLFTYACRLSPSRCEGGWVREGCVTQVVWGAFMTKGSQIYIYIYTYICFKYTNTIYINENEIFQYIYICITTKEKHVGLLYTGTMYI